MIPIIYTAEKPVVVAVMGERLIQEAVEHFRAARVPDYRFPERAASALAILAQRAEHLEREEAEPVTVDDVDRERAADLFRNRTQSGDGHLLQENAARLLAADGIAAPCAELARTAEEAVDAAERIGFPVALKVASPAIAHKSDVGGVALDVGDAEAVRRRFREIVARAQSAAPEAEVQGVTVQQMIAAGQEVIVGVVRDPQFGPLLMFGSGGVEVEGLRDVAFALAPPTREEAEGLLARTWAGRKLGGYRNVLPADREATLDVLFRLSQLAADLPELAEIEINPLRVLPAGQGAVAVDVRATASGRLAA